jgi:hypothetical protein
MSFLRPVAFFDRRFHAKQEEAWLAYKAGLDIVLPWGRRSGKSDLFAEIQIEDVEETGYPSLFTAVTKVQARRIIWPKLCDRLKHEPGWKPNESRLEFIYKKGPFISVKGADMRPDDLAGGAYRTIACDELALWKKPEVRQKILAPMLADYDGQFLNGSTKRGKNHFYELHQEALKQPGKSFVIEADMFDNPFISERGRRKVIAQYPGGELNLLYQQEVLNRYVVFQGMVFALDQDSYTERRWDPADLEFSIHWRGADHGFSPDPTACLWIAYNPRKGYFQVYSEYQQEALLIKQHADVIGSSEPYGVFDTFSDVDPQVIAEYEAVGLPMTPAHKADKKAKLLALVNALRTGRLKIASCCTKLLNQMASYEWDQDGNDHLIDALNYGFNNIELPRKPKDESDTPSRPRRNPTQGQDFGDDE